MSSWLILAGLVGIIVTIISLLVFGIMLANEKQWWGAVGCLAGIAVVVFGAILGDMYATGWWNR